MSWIAQVVDKLVGAAQSAGRFGRTLRGEDRESSGSSGSASSVPIGTETGSGDAGVGVVNVSETNDTRDWRWKGEGFLDGVDLQFTQYIACSETWDHDHCAFCFAKFLPEEVKADWPQRPRWEWDAIVTEGYTTTDRFWWICTRCFNDFDHLVQWVVVDSDDPRLDHA